jgi:hypothetical protein
METRLTSATEFIVCQMVLQTRHWQAAKKKMAATKTSLLVLSEKLVLVG